MIPKKLLHRGTIPAAAFLFDPQLLGEDEARRRLLSLWEPGARVWETDAGELLLLLIRAQNVRAESAPGLPLVRERGHWLALPLSLTEWETLSPSQESLIRAHEGRVLATPLAELTKRDPAEWLTLDTVKRVQTQPLWSPSVEEEDPILLPLPTLPPRELIAKNPATAAALSSLVQALNQAPTSAPTRRPTSQEESTPMGTGSSAGLGKVLERWGRGLLDKLRPGGGGAAPPARSTSDQLRETIREQVLSPEQIEAISRQNAEFLHKMLELFDKGQWHEALQHAIPLGKEGEEAPQGLSLLRPQDSLVIRPTPTPASSSLPWHGLHGGFKQLYREAVERLKEEGRFEEAAYVLAELLREDEEAVSFLERNGQLRLAAELAEARNLPPALVVRQWWLAKERERALTIARRHQCFSDAIFRLERSQNTTAAETLRVEWAQLHAEWGDYARAVATLETVETARPLARRWAELGVEIGGVGGAQLLARLLLWSESPEEAEPWQERALALLAEPEAATERLHLLTPLFASGAQSPLLRPLLRTALRAALADQGAARNTLSLDQATSWARSAGLAALEADLPTLSLKPLPLLLDRTTPLTHRIEGGDTGTVPIVDAAALPDGRTLAALGEAGVLLLRHDGKILHRFDIPATSLVVGETGARAIALAHRSSSQRIHVLDLGTRKVTDWGELSLTCWESMLHEGLWRVARNGQLLLLDTLTPTPAALTCDETKEPLLALGPGKATLSRDPDDGTFFFWTEAAPQRRQAVPFKGGTFELTDQSVYWLQTEESDVLGVLGEQTVILYGQVGSLPRSCVLGEPGDTPAGLAAVRLGANELVLCALRDPLGITVLLAPSTPRGLLAPVLELRLGGAERVRLRATESALTLADSQGRVLVLNPVTGQLVRDLRVRL